MKKAPRNPDRIEFRCPACGRDSWLAREPKYDGFTRTGEHLRCALCQHEFAAETDIPFSGSRKPVVFTNADKPRPLRVFSDNEKGRMCRYCAEYVVNPFIQRCALHQCEVQATDTCPHFRPKTDAPPTPDPLASISAPPQE